MIQRIRDWLLERRIAAALAEMVRYQRLGLTYMARATWFRYRDLIQQRSPGQVARMEARMGLREGR